MLRGLATVLVVVPLLMPPGMCICQVVRKVEAATSSGAHQKGAAEPDAPPACCRHCARSKARPDAEPGDQRGPEPDHCPTPNSPDNPCCPIVKAGAWSKITEPVPSAGTLIGLSAVVRPTDWTVTPVSLTRPTGAPSGPSRPIYLHFCTLLI
jgi:hypothetical protein